MGPEWLAAAGLIGAALIMAWPVGGRRARRRQRLIITGRRGTAPPRSPVWAYRHLPPSRSILAAAGVAAAVGALASGPVAAVIGGAYAGLAVRGVLRHRSVAAAMSERSRRLDGLCSLAADLRAGLPVPLDAAPAGTLPPKTVPAAEDAADPRCQATDRITVLARASGRLAEQTGAPLAELIERIEADSRAMDRARASAAAQASGARATAWLLAGLPLGGIALGYGIGVDPLHVLLHTPIGAGCAVTAIALQFGGLAWTERLVAGGERET